jgi:hypothetical protein
MKPLSVLLARSVWLFQISDWNPDGRAMHPVFFSLIEKYKFIKVPQLNEIDWQKGIKFEDGTFKTSAGKEITVTLTVYPDGAIADTRSSTKDSDEFLDQTLSFLSATFGYSEYHTILRKKLYTSELHIRMEQPLEHIHSGTSQFMNRIASSISLNHVPFRMGINFSSDPAIGGTQLLFRLEPAINFPFSENRYYSHAPLQTENHIQLLEEFESTFLT